MEQLTTPRAKFQFGTETVELWYDDLVKDGCGELQFVGHIELGELAYAILTRDVIGFRVQ